MDYTVAIDTQGSVQGASRHVHLEGKAAWLTRPGCLWLPARGTPATLHALAPACAAELALRYHAWHADLMGKAGAQGIPWAIIVDVEGTIVFAGHPRDPAFEPLLKAAAAAAAEKRAKAPLPLVTDSREQLMAKGIKELKAILTDRGIGLAGLAEKADLVGKIEEVCRTVTYYK